MSTSWQCELRSSWSLEFVSRPGSCKSQEERKKGTILILMPSAMSTMTLKDHYHLFLFFLLLRSSSFTSFFSSIPKKEQSFTPNLPKCFLSLSFWHPSWTYCIRHALGLFVASHPSFLSTPCLLGIPHLSIFFLIAFLHSAHPSEPSVLVLFQHTLHYHHHFLFLESLDALDVASVTFSLLPHLLTLSPFFFGTPPNLGFSLVQSPRYCSMLIQTHLCPTFLWFSPLQARAAFFLMD